MGTLANSEDPKMLHNAQNNCLRQSYVRYNSEFSLFHIKDLVCVLKRIISTESRDISFKYPQHIYQDEFFMLHIQQMFKKFGTLFSFFSQVIRAGIHKTLIRVANIEDPGHTALQKQSDLGLHCLSRLLFFDRLLVF